MRFLKVVLVIFAFLPIKYYSVIKNRLEGAGKIPPNPGIHVGRIFPIGRESREVP